MADDAYTTSAQSFSRNIDAFSDDVLVERLYDLASQMISGKSRVDPDELAQVDAVVYRRLQQAYSKDPQDAVAPTRLDS